MRAALGDLMGYSLQTGSSYENLRIVSMKIAIIGLWHWDFYEKAFADALEEKGVQIIKVKIRQKRLPSLDVYTFIINHKIVLRELINERPDLILFWRPVHVWRYTAKTLSLKNIPFVTYNNDSPKPKYKFLSSHLKAYLYWAPYFDVAKLSAFNFVYRKHDKSLLEKATGKPSAVMLPSFDSSVHFRQNPVSDNDHYNSYDISFVGHFEADDRVEYLNALLDAGFDVHVFGGATWNNTRLGHRLRKRGLLHAPVFGREYREVIHSSKINLCFLSERNHDTYTRRCFEIPASGGLLVAPRTFDLTKLLKEGVEAIFFESSSELISNISRLIQDETRIKNIADNGWRKIINCHHISERAEMFLKIISELELD